MQADTPEGTREMYDNSIRDDPHREVALYRNVETGEVIAVQGDANGVAIDHQVWRESFGGNPDAWQLDAHSHPVNPETGVTPFPERLPSSTGGDFSTIEAESAAAGNQARTSTIDVTTENGPAQTHFTFDPNEPRPYKIDYPDPVTGERTQVEFASKEAYEEWYSDNFPGRQAQIESETGGGISRPEDIDGSGGGGGGGGPDYEPDETPLSEVEQEFQDAQGLGGPNAVVDDYLGQKGTSNNKTPGGAPQPPQFERGNFAHTYGPDVGLVDVPPGGIPEQTIPDTGGARPDFTYPREGNVEIKPTHQAEQGQLEADYYAHLQDQETPIGDGKQHTGEVRTYDPQEVQDYMERIGYVESKSKKGGSSSGGGSSGGSAPPPGVSRPAPVPPPDVLPETPTPQTTNTGMPAASTSDTSVPGALASDTSLAGAPASDAPPAAHVVSVSTPEPGLQPGAQTTTSAGGKARPTLSQRLPGAAASATAGAAAGQKQEAGGSGGSKKSNLEPVNPNYLPPPGTPQQLKVMQDQISQTLADRAKAEQAKAKMDAELAKHQANVGPAQQAVQGTQAGITATQAHQQDVTLRDEANKQQQAKQQESQSTVGGYADKAAGLAALSVPLAAFRGFTSLASHLPGDAGAAMAKMNADGEKVTEAFEQMGVNMAEQAAGLPARQQELQGDNARIQASGQQGQAASADLEKSQQGALAFQQANESKIQQATKGQSQAAGQERKLDASAKTRTQKATTLAEQLQAWASEHKAARQKAVEEKTQQIQAKGKVVTAVKED
jgi:hypothetical protein